MPREAGGGGASFGTSHEPNVAFPVVAFTCMMKCFNKSVNLLKKMFY